MSVGVPSSLLCKSSFEVKHLSFLLYNNGVLLVELFSLSIVIIGLGEVLQFSGLQSDSIIMQSEFGFVHSMSVPELQLLSTRSSFTLG